MDKSHWIGLGNKCIFQILWQNTHHKTASTQGCVAGWLSACIVFVLQFLFASDFIRQCSKNLSNTSIEWNAWHLISYRSVSDVFSVVNLMKMCLALAQFRSWICCILLSILCFKCIIPSNADFNSSLTWVTLMAVYSSFQTA